MGFWFSARIQGCVCMYTYLLLYGLFTEYATSGLICWRSAQNELDSLSNLSDVVSLRRRFGFGAAAVAVDVGYWVISNMR